MSTHDGMAELYKSLPVFDADVARWPSFFYKLKLHLEGRDLLHIIDEEKDQKKAGETDDEFKAREKARPRNDAKVRGIIINKLSEEILPMIKDLPTAFKMVERLKKQYEATSAASRIELMDRLLDYKYQE
ncbi:hypothetical protein HDU96_008920, partial [Phlyctochytrium bullatum]